MDADGDVMEVFDSALSAIVEKDDTNVEKCSSVHADPKEIFKDPQSTQLNLEADIIALRKHTDEQREELKLGIKDIEEQCNTRSEKIDNEQNRKKKLQEELEKLKLELKNQQAESRLICQEALQKVPKDRYICGILKNISNIEWDLKVLQTTPSMLKGAIITKSSIKSFKFNTESNDALNVEESLWDMMEEWKHFEKLLQTNEGVL